MCVSERNRQLKRILLVFPAPKNWASRSQEEVYGIHTHHHHPPPSHSHSIIRGFTPNLVCVAGPEYYSSEAYGFFNLRTMEVSSSQPPVEVLPPSTPSYHILRT